ARTDYVTEKEKLFTGIRYDHTTDSGLRGDVGATVRDFHENRINQNTDLSERNRPQQARKIFGNISDEYSWENWTWYATHGFEYNDEYFRDKTNESNRFDFAEGSLYTRHKLHWKETVKLSAGLRGARV